MGARKNGSIKQKLSRIERLIRSRILGFPFVVVNAFTKWEIHGKENLISILKSRQMDRKGIITVSNHISLFDDPLVIMALLRLYSFTVETKCWWSTACAANFNPTGKSFASKFVRYFSDVSNMIFLSRAKKRKDAPPVILDDPMDYISERVGDDGMETLAFKAKQEGKDIYSYLKNFYTMGSDGYNGKNAPLNQIGMIETIAKANAGQWVHLFPEGGRSRNIRLRSPRAGVGKVIYHARDSVVVPMCFYGMHEVLPVGSYLPRLFKKVVINVGKPIPSEALNEVRRRPPALEAFNDVSRLVMRDIALLRPLVLERYLGANKAAKVMLEEAQLARALQSVETKDAPSDVFVEPYAEAVQEREGEVVVQDSSSSPVSGARVIS